MERGSYRGKGSYGGGRDSNAGRSGGDRRNNRGGRDSNAGPSGGGGSRNYGGGRDSNANSSYYGGGRSDYGGSGDSGGRFYQRSQYVTGSGSGSGSGRGFPSQPEAQPQPQPRWQQPSEGSSKPNQSLSQTHPDIGSPKISEQKAVDITPMRRPDRGGIMAARNCNLLVNHYLVMFDPAVEIKHYNMAVERISPPNSNPPLKIPKSDLKFIREKLFSGSLLSRSAYDGQKNIFSTVMMPNETITIDVGRISYLVTLSLANKLELSKLTDYLNGHLLPIPRDILQGLDLVVKENPAKQCLSSGRCFFPCNPPVKETDLEHAILAIGGFRQSLKPTSQGLSLCLDYSVMSFLKNMSVLDFLKTHISGFEVNEFSSHEEAVRQVLFGLKVNVNHRQTNQKYTIEGLSSRITREITFDELDPNREEPPKETSLVSYFSTKYDKQIQENLPALKFQTRGSKPTYVPMEFCDLVKGQRYPKENLDKTAADVLKTMSLVPPGCRQDKIQKMLGSPQGPRGGGIVENFGINVDTSMTNVTGRVIQPPQLKLGKPNGEIASMTLEVDKCQWNLMGRSMVEGKAVECWGILDFTSKESNWHKLRGYQFVEKLIDKYRRFGIVMKEPVCYEESGMWSLGDYNSLCKLLENIDDKVQKRYRRRLQFLLCVMADKHQGYKWLKWIAETKVGIVTQCCLSGNANKGKDQYLTNLALKINAKIGGSNVELVNRLPHLEGEGHVMFIGADVNHPGCRDINSPSIAAVVATVNWPAANRYAARIYAQDHRLEKILNFGRICHELVLYYEKMNKVRPEKIVIFRDGVSESQFYMVLTEELQDLKAVFRESNYFPTITLIVAQKRHQTRFFPITENDGISNGNVFPGTVVDTQVVHPFEFDFYLCSHYGNLGTSKPTHYHVLCDEHKFTSDDLQKLIYDMCFTFARCTKPVSLVPPVYYADLAAYRGRLYYEAMQSHGATASSSSPSISPNNPVCYKLHADVENIMFFI